MQNYILYKIAFGGSAALHFTRRPFFQYFDWRLLLLLRRKLSVEITLVVVYITFFERFRSVLEFSKFSLFFSKSSFLRFNFALPLLYHNLLNFRFVLSC